MIESFLKLHSNPARPLGLAYSGGADSRYLLERLLPFQGALFFRLHLLHVEHSLRPSSCLEAEEAERVAKAYGLPFHKETLDPKALTGNIEAACRARRYGFFEEVAKEEGLQSVCTAHHADD
ncbi:MAG: tRNA lysidine(34) synthetase TilS, partial [Chlamydiia bacterium]|nr:tRNA lysidine(34) synthetase TilS [Chlamydiia bacterium]